MKKNNVDKWLLLLIAISILNTVILLFDGLSSVKYVLLLFTIFIVITSPNNKSFPIILYIIPNSGLYDIVGFKYILNISIFIVFIKYLIKEDFKIYFKNTTLIILVILYEIILSSLYGNIDFKIVQIFSLLFSYMVFSYVIYYLYKDKLECVYNPITDYKFPLYGLIMSIIYSGINVYKIWGGNIPTAYRFIGLFRDPNYYSLFCIILAFVILFNSYISLTNRIILFVLVSIIGFLSVSKMYILLFILSIFMIIFYNIFIEKKINIKYIIYFVVAFSICGFIFINSPIKDTLYNKYVYRMQTNKLMTGRDILQTHYIKELMSNPRNIVLGNTLTYYGRRIGLGEDVYYINSISSVMKEAYSTMVAHNTYLDIILSWGFMGLVYILYIFNSLKYFFIRKNRYKFNNIYNIIFFVLLISFNALSLLEADMLIILVSFILCTRMKVQR